MRKRLKWILALTAAIVLAAGGTAALAAKPTVVVLGNLVLKLNGGVTPKALPKHKLAPITLNLSAELSTKDGSHPPALQIFEAEFDKNGTINAKGLPACKRGKIEARDTASAKAACKSSIVGEGSAEAEVEFAEQKPFKAKGPLIVFNGGVKGGKTQLYVHVYANVPAPTAFITPVTVTKIHAGKYGNKVVGKIPVIAGGAGSTIKFQIKNHKIFRYKGKKQSYLLAKCATGKFYARGSAKFSDGSRLKGNVIRPCTPKG
jgi:hypothetical protein